MRLTKLEAVSFGHRPASGAPKPWEPWIFVVIAATTGLLTSLMLNLAGGEASEDHKRPREFPDIHPDCLRLALDCRGAQRVGVTGRRGRRNLGSIPARTDGWIHRSDGLQRGAESAAVVLRDACVVEPEAHAFDAGTVDDRLRASSLVGNPGLPGLRGLGMEWFADFCTGRANCGVAVRCKPHDHLPAPANCRHHTAEHDYRVVTKRRTEMCYLVRPRDSSKSHSMTQIVNPPSRRTSSPTK
jgi:hypothetical protein